MAGWAVEMTRWTHRVTGLIFRAIMIAYATLIRAFRALCVAGAVGLPVAGCERGPAIDPSVAERPLPSAGTAVDDELADAGAWYFRRNCAACHMIGGEQELIGPNLEGVTERRPMPWIASMIRRPDSMVMNDPVARALLEEYKVPMANRQLDDVRVRAIVEFLWRADHGPVGGVTGPASTLEEAADTGRTPTGIAWSAEGEGSAVVLIHGTNLDRRVWRDETTAWSTRHRVVRYDLRSHGDSDDARGPWSDVEDLVAVMNAAGVESAVLVGLSAGASVALEAALAHGDRVDGLVLVSPSIRGYRPAPGEVPDVFGPLMQALGAGDMEAAGDALLETPTMAVPDTVRPRVEAMVRDNLRLFSVDPTWATPPVAPPLSRLDEVDVPTLVVFGGADMGAVASQARLLGDGIEGARLMKADGGVHLVNLERPRWFQAEVERWLDARGGGE